MEILSLFLMSLPKSNRPRSIFLAVKMGRVDSALFLKSLKTIRALHLQFPCISLSLSLSLCLPSSPNWTHKAVSQNPLMIVSPSHDFLPFSVPDRNHKSCTVSLLGGLELWFTKLSGDFVANIEIFMSGCVCSCCISFFFQWDDGNSPVPSLFKGKMSSEESGPSLCVSAGFG